MTSIGDSLHCNTDHTMPTASCVTGSTYSHALPSPSRRPVLRRLRPHPGHAAQHVADGPLQRRPRVASVPAAALRVGATVGGGGGGAAVRMGAAPPGEVISKRRSRLSLCHRQPRPVRRRPQRRRQRRRGGHPQQAGRACCCARGIWRRGWPPRAGPVPWQMDPPLRLPPQRRAQLRTQAAQRRAGRLRPRLGGVRHADGRGPARGSRIPAQSQLRGCGSRGAGRHLAVRHLGVRPRGGRVCCGGAPGGPGSGQGLGVHCPLLVQNLGCCRGASLRLSQLLPGHILRVATSQSDGAAFGKDDTHQVPVQALRQRGRCVALVLQLHLGGTQQLLGALLLELRGVRE